MSEELMFVSGHLNGTCEKCKEPTTGHFHSDEDRDEDDNYWIVMRCVGCSHKQWFNLDPNVLASPDESALKPREGE